MGRASLMPAGNDKRELDQHLVALAHDILTVRLEAPFALRGAMTELREITRSDLFLGYSLTPGDTHWEVGARSPCDAVGEELVHDFLQLVAKAPRGWGAFDPGRPPGPHRNRVMTRAETVAEDEVPSLPVFELWRRHGLQESDQLRVLLCDGPVLLGWVGGYRKAPYTERERYILKVLRGPLARRLRVERRLAGTEPDVPGLAAVLAAFPLPALVLDSRGGLVDANPAGRRQWNFHRASTRTLREWREDPAVVTTRMRQPGLPDHYLVAFQGTDTDRAVRLVDLGRRWRLTPRQRDVLDLVVQGDSNATIAHKLECHVRTAEVHVSALLKKAGCDRRTELASLFWAS